MDPEHPEVENPTVRLGGHLESLQYLETMVVYSRHTRPVGHSDAGPRGTRGVAALT
jgi:hypothetical protein